MRKPSTTNRTTAEASSKLSPWMRLMLWRFMALLGVWHVLVFAPFAWRQLERTDQNRDLVIYYHTAQRVRAGGALYTPRPQYGPDKKPFDFLYPPPFAAALAPGGGLPWNVWSRGALVVLMVAWWVYAICLVSLCGAALRPATIGVAGLVLFLAPGSYRALSLGQIDPLLWMAFGLALVGLQRATQRTRPGAGWMLGGMTLVKIYSLWTFFALRESASRKQVGLGAMLALLIGGLLGVLVCGLDAYVSWVRLVLPVAGQGTFNADNMSLSMGVLRLASEIGWHYGGGPLPALAKAWLSAAACIGPLAVLWATRRMRETQRVALVGVVAAWCAPLCWTTYIPLVLAPLALWWQHKSSRT